MTRIDNINVEYEITKEQYASSDNWKKAKSYSSDRNSSKILTTSQLDSMMPSGSIPGGPSYVGCSLSLGPFFESPGHWSSFLKRVDKILRGANI